MKSVSLALTVFAMALPGMSLAWGGRGHHTICDAASFLVKEKGLHDYLQAKPHMMGYLCNIPDIYWRDIDTERVGDATHYVDVELLGIPMKDIPLDYKKIVAEFTDKQNPIKPEAKIKSIPKEFGSNWWRADQFYRRATSMAEKWKAAAAPANSAEEQDNGLPFNQYAYDFTVNLGLMGHFVGDNGQPFHSTVDYDGWMSGHGGIHAYYEETLVAAQPEDLTIKVIEKARELQKAEKRHSFMVGDTVTGRMKELALIANSELKKIYDLDKVKKPSSVVVEKGMSLKTPAERESAEKLAPKFRSLIIQDMARSAALLAKFWDEAYVEVGRPKLTAHKSYRFPIQPEFVAPDYFETKEAPKK